MAISSLVEPAQGSRRQGTRRVANLSPEQLERKRAFDRDAQRAIRDRKKEHVNNLERELEDVKSELEAVKSELEAVKSELEDFKSEQNRDSTVQELPECNQALKTELMQLKEKAGFPMIASHQSTLDTTFSVTIPDSMTSRPQYGTPATPLACETTLNTDSGAIFRPHSSQTLSKGGVSIPEHGELFFLTPSETSVLWTNNDPLYAHSNIFHYPSDYSANGNFLRVPPSWYQDGM